jgi:hypothetical protein
LSWLHFNFRIWARIGATTFKYSAQALSSAWAVSFSLVHGQIIIQRRIELQN